VFLDEWEMGAEFGWSVDDIFARDGLAWWLGIETVTALGEYHAVTETNRVYERRVRADWLAVYGAPGKG
jgi:hypothetical protein